MTEFPNPFRPGAGHPPPYLAGREAEKEQFDRLLRQEVILENFLLSGLRGIGKTVLLESLKPRAIEQGWLWVGSDLDEAAAISEENLASRLCADLAVATAAISVRTGRRAGVGFTGAPEAVEERLDYARLRRLYESAPGLSVDKFKAVLSLVWSAVRQARAARGIVFAYDEAQNLADNPAASQFPLSVLLDAFQSLQKQELPLMLALVGLPTLFPHLVKARTYSERMFRVVELRRLADAASREAIERPIADARCPVALSDQSVEEIVRVSKGYPYFIQYICREVYDIFIQKSGRGDQLFAPYAEIMRKLDADFFSARWAQATDRQRDLMRVAAFLQIPEDEEFTVQQLVKRSAMLEQPFKSSQANQILAALCQRGLAFKSRYGKYSFAVPLFADFIRRQYNGGDD